MNHLRQLRKTFGWQKGSPPLKVTPLKAGFL
jgi:hypothetical protein